MKYEETSFRKIYAKNDNYRVINVSIFEIKKMDSFAGNSLRLMSQRWKC